MGFSIEVHLIRGLSEFSLQAYCVISFNLNFYSILKVLLLDPPLGSSLVEHQGDINKGGGSIPPIPPPPDQIKKKFYCWFLFF